MATVRSSSRLVSAWVVLILARRGGFSSKVVLDPQQSSDCAYELLAGRDQSLSCVLEEPEHYPPVVFVGAPVAVGRVGAARVGDRITQTALGISLPIAFCAKHLPLAKGLSCSWK
jgi:hypothetical protein